MLTKKEVQEFLGIQSIPKNFDKFVEYWNDEIKEVKYEVKQCYHIISDIDYEKITAGGKQCLFKSIWMYNSSKIFKSETMYREYLKEKGFQKQAELKKYQWSEEKQKEWEQLDQVLDALGYPKYEEIARGLLSYYIKEPGIRYYWSLIGENYRLLGNGDILIENSIFNSIKMSTEDMCNLQGSVFLERAFEYKHKRGSHRIVGSYIKEEKEDKKSGAGVYAIMKDNEIIYVGMTMRNFNIRWREHKMILDGEAEVPNSYMKLYNSGLTSKDIEFIELFNINKANYEGTITARDIQVIELAFINLYKPKYNYIGINKPYQLI